MEHCDVNKACESMVVLAEALYEGKANPYPEQVCILMRTKHCPLCDRNNSI